VVVVAASWRCRFPVGGTTLEHRVLKREVLGGETQSIDGRATAAPSASYPPWRCLSRSLALACGSVGGWLARVLCAVVVEVRKVSVLAARCRGPMGAGGLELACMVLW
jgi:hypothetical protein